MSVLRDIAGVLLCAAGYHDEERLRPGVYECRRPTCLQAREVEHEKDPEREARADALMIELRMVAAARDSVEAAPVSLGLLTGPEVHEALSAFDPEEWLFDAEAMSVIYADIERAIDERALLDVSTRDMLFAAMRTGIWAGLHLASRRIHGV